LLVDSLDSREGERLRDWIETHPRYLDLIHAALELEAEEKTA
jgi:hypothetical protein